MERKSSNTLDWEEEEQSISLMVQFQTESFACIVHRGEGEERGREGIKVNDSVSREIEEIWNREGKKEGEKEEKYNQ